MAKIAVFTFSLLLLALLSTTARSLRFELKSGHLKCISEDVKVSAMSVGKYSVIAPGDTHQASPDVHKITVRVTSPYGNNIHHGDLVESGNFAFTATEAGDYMACFWAPDHKTPETVTVEFDWKTGVAAKDWSNVMKKGKIDVMELELRKLMDTVQSIHDEMFYLREREEEMQDLNRTTNTRMAWFGLLSLVICLSVASLQLWHLKSFFERKKLL